MIESLFLPSAVDAQRHRPFSRITIKTPFPVWVAAAASTVIAIAIVIFFGTASYTKRASVSGRLVPTTGAIRLFPHQAAVITEQLVAEGQVVHAGQPIFKLSADRRSNEAGGILAGITEEARSREGALIEEMGSVQRIYDEDVPSDDAKKVALRAEIKPLDDMISQARARVELADRSVERFEVLRSKGFTTAITLDQAMLGQIDAKTQLSSLERDRHRLASQIIDLDAQASKLPFEQRGKVAQLRRSLSQAKQEVVESEARREEIVRAPVSGFVTGIDGTVGQTVNVSRALATILPASSTLEAILYVSSRSIGFVKPGTSVNLRYQAFPYQKFGQHHGRVISISKVAFAVSDLPGGEAVSMQGASGPSENVYIVKVKIFEQSIRAYGKQERLQAGMSLEADLLLERRRLYEWVLEPLLTLTGKIGL